MEINKSILNNKLASKDVYLDNRTGISDVWDINLHQIFQPRLTENSWLDHVYISM